MGGQEKWRRSGWLEETKPWLGCKNKKKVIVINKNYSKTLKFVYKKNRNNSNVQHREWVYNV